MDDIVVSSKSKMGVDWKLAYVELQRLTRMMKWDAKQRGINHFYFSFGKILSIILIFV